MRCREGLLKIGDNVFRGFESDGKANNAIRDA
jgi:hypothetical protein